MPANVLREQRGCWQEAPLADEVSKRKKLRNEQRSELDVDNK